MTLPHVLLSCVLLIAHGSRVLLVHLPHVTLPRASALAPLPSRVKLKGYDPDVSPFVRTGASKAAGKAPAAKKLKAGQAARDAVKAAGRQRRKDKRAAAASVAPDDENVWGPFDKKGREIGETDEEDSDEDMEAVYAPQVCTRSIHTCKSALRNLL